MSVSIFATFTPAAGGGGGGGGGGGAARNVIVIALGNASVNISGIRIKMPTMTASRMNETNVVLPRLVFSLPPDSIRLSSNICFLPAQTYEALDTSCNSVVPNTGQKNGRHSNLLKPC